MNDQQRFTEVAALKVTNQLVRIVLQRMLEFLSGRLAGILTQSHNLYPG